MDEQCCKSHQQKILSGLKHLNYWGYTKDYEEASDIGYFLEVDFQYSEKLYELHNVLPFLPEIIKIGKIENH